MKIAQLISGIRVPLNNQEGDFITRHRDRVFLPSLNEQDQWLAQNLVRKGFYSISKDNKTLIKNIDETTS